MFILDGFVLGRKKTGLERHFEQSSKIYQNLAQKLGMDLVIFSRKQNYKCKKIPTLFLNFTYYFFAGFYIPKDFIFIGLSGLLPIFNLNRYKKVIYLHDLFWRKNKYKNLKGFVYYFLYNYSIKNSDFIICISKKTQLDLKNFYPNLKNKSIVIYNFIDQQNKIEPPDKKENYVISVGMNSLRKNPLICYEIAKKLYQELNFKWIIIGLTKNIERYFEKKGIQIKKLSFIEILDEVTDKELINLYRKSFASFIFSKDEGFCYPYLESNINFCLPLCSNIPTLKEISGEFNSCFFDFPIEPNKVYEKLFYLKKYDKEYESLLLNGFKNSLRFNKKKIENETLSFIKQII